MADDDETCLRKALEWWEKRQARMHEVVREEELKKRPAISEKQRRVVCAAIRAPDGEVLIGIRHYDLGMFRVLSARADGGKFLNRVGPDQGFVDQFGTFMNRVEAFEVAVKAGQTKARGPALYSEDLY